jgi:hypothetical protein
MLVTSSKEDAHERVVPALLDHLGRASSRSDQVSAHRATN